MQILIALQAFIFAVVVPLVVHLLKAFGIGAVTYTGLTIVTDQLKNLAMSHFNGLPADIMAIAGIMQLDVAFNMIMSAVLASLVLKSFDKVTGTKKSYIFKA